MTLTLEPILLSAGIDPADAQAIRHAFVREHEDTGLPGIHADSTDDEILAYTSRQSAKPRSSPSTRPGSGWCSSARAATGPGCGRCWRTAAKSSTTALCAPSTWSPRSASPISGTGS